MKTRIKQTVLALVVAAICTVAIGVLLTPPVSAASGCWKVDCNVCCRTSHGVVCTQRACL